MKTLAAICPCCQHAIVLGPAHETRPVEQDEAKVIEHIVQHTVFEWVECVTALRTEIKQQSDLRNFPRIAMPRA